jgi:hypothetical protein
VYPGSAPASIDEVVAGFFNLPSTPVSPSVWFEEQFSAENQARALHTLVQSLHSDAKIALSTGLQVARREGA